MEIVAVQNSPYPIQITYCPESKESQHNFEIVLSYQIHYTPMFG